MAISNRDRIGKTLDYVRDGLLPYLSNQLTIKIGNKWETNLPPAKNNLQDISILLGLFMDHWAGIFKSIHSQSVRAYISELKEARNKWAHSLPISSDDADRYLDTAIRLCKNINAKDQTEEIRLIREELQQQIQAERVRYRSRNQATIENNYLKGLKPWREVITPHRDVIDGKYLKAEFAANLDLVRRGKASFEYLDPVEFYRRTFITESLKKLLIIALKRFNNKVDEPVIELQTNFGGGKTHSMLALYHLCSGTPLDQLPGLDEVCSEIGINQIPKPARAVLVGNAMNPAKIEIKSDGTKVQTIWGEMAWQLGGKEAFNLIKENDVQKIPPGAPDLAVLFKQYGPCLILIDEWVAYARNLVSNSELPSGTFDSQITFAQQLTEAIQETENALLLISVPKSRDEIGGEHGDIACSLLKNFISRIAYQWRPATTNESYEIVRRRLFEQIPTQEDGTSRDTVIKAFCDMYAVNKAEFPSDSREYRYRDIMSRAYPIHPELFKKLYEEWSTLDRFQKTRGVLRLLALTIESLWNENSKDLLIMPSSIPVNDNDVKNEFVKFLDDQWEPIISQDVDGSQSIPTYLDRKNPSFGKLSACKRVARTLYIGTAPGSETQQKGKGINDQSVKLGCLMPGESIGVFGDALRRLSNKGKYIQQEGDRYWIDLSPNLNRIADDYKESYLRHKEDLIFELNGLIQQEAKKRGNFDGVHAGLINNEDIPDNQNNRLVLIAAEYYHKRGLNDSPASLWINDCLKNKGNIPRKYLNKLIFLAPDERNLQDLLNALAEKRSWQKIKDEKISLNLTASQENQSDIRINQAISTITLRIPETWCHLLIPHQEEPTDEISIEEKIMIGGRGSLAERSFQKSIKEDYLYEELGALTIINRLNKYLWKDKNHILVQDLIEWCSKYIYLPRVASDEVILNSLISSTVLNFDTNFYLAKSFDETSKLYEGLVAQNLSTEIPSLNSYIVKREIGDAQQKRSGSKNNLNDKTSTTTSENDNSLSTSPPPESIQTQYTASLKLDPKYASLTTSKFMDKVVSHLQALPGSEIEIQLEINVKNKNGIDKKTALIVLENSNSLNVDNPQIF